MVDVLASACICPHIHRLVPSLRWLWDLFDKSSGVNFLVLKAFKQPMSMLSSSTTSRILSFSIPHNIIGMCTMDTSSTSTCILESSQAYGYSVQILRLVSWQALTTGLEKALGIDRHNTYACLMPLRSHPRSMFGLQRQWSLHSRLSESDLKSLD